MSQLVTPEQDAHWYRRDGSPCYEITGKNGKPRVPTIRDARELDLVPSVTTILKVIAKPGLESWKQTQCIMSALTLPRKDGESVDDFAQRIVEDSKAEGIAAADFGSKIHQGIEDILSDKPISEELKPFVEPAVDAIPSWNPLEYEKFLQKCEFTFANPLWGGRIDYQRFGPDKVIIDFKTQGTTPDKPLKVYPEWGLQLAAYAQYDGISIYNIVVSRNEPGRVLVHDWTPEFTRLYDTFIHVLRIWQFFNTL